MEIELKYLIENETLASKIFEDEYIKRVEIANTYEEPHMWAVYLDTANGSLRKNGIALRFREEGNKIFATLKWTGLVEDGLHIRGEINVPVDENFIKNPNVEIFKESEMYDKLVSYLGDEALEKVMVMDFIRQAVKLDLDGTICELSFDKGEIITINGNVMLCELEIELYSGDKEKILELGKALALKYNLKPCNISKFERGLKKLGLLEL